MRFAYRVQVIIHLKFSVEQYVKEAFHIVVRPPEICPVCKAHDSLRTLGYYSRDTTGATGLILSFWVKRFLCLLCHKSCSLLPSFAQPYRLVAQHTLQDFIQGNLASLDVLRNLDRLKKYQKRFLQFVVSLKAIVGNYFGRAPPKESATAFWQKAVAGCGSLAELTILLTCRFQTTCFGIYACHQPSYGQSH